MDAFLIFEIRELLYFSGKQFKDRQSFYQEFDNYV